MAQSVHLCVYNCAVFHPCRSASAWETFCMGLEEFLARARERRAQREAPGDEQQILPTAVGAESLIVGAAAYKLKTL